MGLNETLKVDIGFVYDYSTFVRIVCIDCLPRAAASNRGARPRLVRDREPSGPLGVTFFVGGSRARPAPGTPLHALALRHTQTQKAHAIVPVMLPRAALMPPCAATVWERVGNSLVMHLFA